MTDINNKLLCLFEGKCWHEPHEIYLTNNHMVATTPVQECALCGCRYPEYPSYSTSPADRERLLQYLMGQEIWKALESYAFHRVYKYQFVNDFGIVDVTEFIPWLFLPLPDTSIPRWLFLLQEWLGLEETVDRFGWKTEVFHDVDGIAECKVLTEWARMVQDEEEG